MRSFRMLMTTLQLFLMTRHTYFLWCHSYLFYLKYLLWCYTYFLLRHNYFLTSHFLCHTYFLTLHLFIMTSHLFTGIVMPQLFLMMSHICLIIIVTSLPVSGRSDSWCSGKGLLPSYCCSWWSAWHIRTRKRWENFHLCSNVGLPVVWYQKDILQM